MTFFYGQSLERNKKKIKCLLKYWNFIKYLLMVITFIICVCMCVHTWRITGYGRKGCITIQGNFALS